jgi:hypothetical protein
MFLENATKLKISLLNAPISRSQSQIFSGLDNYDTFLKINFTT